MKKSSSKAQASYKTAKASIKRATIALRNKRKGGKRVVWEMTA